MTKDIVKYKERLDKIWEKYKPGVKFGIHDRLHHGGLLFVGINPSEVNSIQEHQEKDKNGNIVYSKEFSDEYHYFKKYKEIAKEVEMEWAYADYCYVIETTQSSVVEKYIENSELKEFVAEQYAIAKDIIKEVAPKLIVVCNAKASELIKEDLIKKEGGLFDNAIGTYRLNDKNQTPIIFSSMLTGQRAMDVHSYERMLWQIKLILGKLK